MTWRPERRSAARAAAKITGASSARSDVELEVTQDNETDLSIEELREFLSADLFEVPADPAFKQGLRDKLWQMIQSRTFGYGPPRDD